MARVPLTVLITYCAFHGGGGVKFATAFVADPCTIISPVWTRTTSCRNHIPGSTITSACCINKDGKHGEDMAISSDSSSTLSRHRPEKSEDDTSPPPSHLLFSRKQFLSIASSATFAIISHDHPQTAYADDPSNLYYKSKADEEDPLVVFGKSLQNMNGGDTGSSSALETGDASSFSFSDISFPPSSQSDTVSSSSPPPMMGGDLNKVLQEKKESQKRAVDPRTHG